MYDNIDACYAIDGSNGIQSNCQHSGLHPNMARTCVVTLHGMSCAAYNVVFKAAKHCNSLDKQQHILG